jgi:hypothetical protein
VQAAAGGLDGGGREELPGINASMPLWRKSSYSACNGNCVEVAGLRPGRIGVRDTKDAGHGPVLEFRVDVWQSFLDGIKKGT